MVWSKSRGLRILFFGKIGAGKSSLINTLLGKKVAEEGANIYSQTTAVRSYAITIVRETIEGVTITLLDSPGLRDPFKDERKTLSELKEICQNVDIFVYCTSLTQTRIGQDEYDSIMNLTQALGDGMWKKGLIALTFANEVRPTPSSHDVTVEKYFKERVSDWGEALKNAIKKTGVNNKVAEAIPVVPTSYRNIALPDTTEANWFSAFWSTCIQCTRLVSLPALLAIKRNGPLLKDPVTNTAINARRIAEAQRLKEIGDAIECEIVRENREDFKEIFPLHDRLSNEHSFDKMLENSQLSEVLVATIQNQIDWEVYLGILTVSMIVLTLAIVYCNIM